MSATTLQERFVNNFLTIMIARVAMILTPILLTIFAYIASEVWDSVTTRLDAIEATEAKQGSQIQDHESRLKFSDEKANQYADQIERRFNDLTGSLKDLNQQIITINGSIIRLQTTIENRLPPRTAKVDGDSQAGIASELPQ